MEKILNELISLKDEKYADFHSGLVPNKDRDYFIGVRTPILRKMAKEINASSYRDEFLSELPHKYHEENQLHAFIISLTKDFSKAMEEIEAFLPYINNWATCDQTNPKVFKKHLPELRAAILKWLSSDETYTIRFGVDMAMMYFLGETFDSEMNDIILNIHSDEYYINMVVAWYGATALAKNWDETVTYLQDKKMQVWTHNKMIQKAIESYRITDEQKTYLRTLKISTR